MNIQHSFCQAVKRVHLQKRKGNSLSPYKVEQKGSQLRGQKPVHCVSNHITDFHHLPSRSLNLQSGLGKAKGA